MAIDIFACLHGAALTKLLRSEQPVTLRMIETRPRDAWSAYLLNDAALLFIKYSTNRKQIQGGFSWRFTFGDSQLEQMSSSQHKVYLALVCGSESLSELKRGSCVCLLEPKELHEVIDTNSAAPQGMTVRWYPGKSLRVMKDGREMFKIPQNRLEKAHPLSRALQAWTAEIAALQEGDALDVRPAYYLYRLLAVGPFATAVKNENAARNLAIFSRVLSAFQTYYQNTRSSAIGTSRTSECTSSTASFGCSAAAGSTSTRTRTSLSPRARSRQ
ncbi:hypothetical protein JDY09_06435 [Thermoleophilum album]|uniref:hypothetical protein n=1 Tax=Thermoleophilum album TaxID=29539 RepID=UPI00237CBD04|nr:hypothetical protein [Thermoleophilum album]WDT93026.1 hypothetical protein JDY09_06435 [Thermoleophilum album]